MAQHDYSLANQSGSAFRSDLNNALAAIVSQNSGSAEPTTKYAYQYWIDTSTTPALIKQRNAANSDWITLGEVDGQTLAADGTVAKPGISFASDINTGLRRNAADDISIVTGGTQAITIDSSQQVGIGTTAPAGKLHVTSGGVGFNPNADADELFLENTGNCGITIGCGTNQKGNIYFGEQAVGVSVGAIVYDTSSNYMAFSTNGLASERMRITSDGKLILGGTTANTAINYSLVTSGRIQSDASYSNTTATAANLHITSAGLLVRSTSSARYKTNVETLEDSYADAVLNARPVYFNSIASDDTAHPDWSYWGFIAEEVAEIDPRLVHYSEDDDGNLQAEGVQYDRFVPHLINLVKRQKDQIADLTARIEALEAAG